MKMFNLLGIGEKAGSGFDVMRASTRSAGKPDPTIAERHEPDVVTLVLPLEASGMLYTRAMGWGNPDDPSVRGWRKSDESSKPTSRNQQTLDDTQNRTQISDDYQNRAQISDDFSKGVTGKRKTAILTYVQDHQQASRREIASAVGLQPSRTSELLAELLREGRLRAEGSGRARVYSIVDREVS